MQFAKHIYRLPLALLLLGLFVFANQRGAALPHAPAFKLSVQERYSSPGDSVDGSQYPISLFANIERPAAPIIDGSHGGSIGSAAHGAGILPHSGFRIVSCSQSDIRKRLAALQEHYTFQQRLSLYPKHWFW